MTMAVNSLFLNKIEHRYGIKTRCSEVNVLQVQAEAKWVWSRVRIRTPGPP